MKNKMIYYYILFVMSAIIMVTKVMSEEVKASKIDEEMSETTSIIRPFLSMNNSSEKKGCIVEFDSNIGLFSVFVPPQSKFVVLGSPKIDGKVFVKGLGIEGREYGFTFSINAAISKKNAWSVSGSPRNVVVENLDGKFISSSLTEIYLKSVTEAANKN